MQALSFAYGSNLCVGRLRGRVPSAVAVGRARLPGRAHRSRCASLPTAPSTGSGGADV
jgi:hypothetical protein